MSSRFILAIDQGTTGSRAMLYDSRGKVAASAYQEFHQYYPQPGWVEHDPQEIWKSVVSVISKTLQTAKTSSNKIAAIAVTNQRETTVLWDRDTGRSLGRAIVWQDRRTSAECDRLKKRGVETLFQKKTGLVLDPYFSGTKIKWLLDHQPALRVKARKGRLCFGTIDSWLLWNLTGGKSHATDFTNASRTLIFNIHTKKWDSELLKILSIPTSLLPRVQEAASLFGKTCSAASVCSGIPIYSLIGDQQAALFGQACYAEGEAKNTYGTGSFVMMNMGKRLRKVPFGLLATLACDARGKPCYALEGSIFIAGAAVQWLRDGLKFFKSASETESLIRKVKDTGGVIVIPAFAGLGSPYWKADVRGAIFGITRGTTRGHLIRATLESIAHQSADVMEAMKSLIHHPLHALKVDGGATRNKFLMQFQADLLGIPVLVSDISESTVWGAAKLAGLASGFWPSLKPIDRARKCRTYFPRMKSPAAKTHRERWRLAIKGLLHTVDN